MSLHPQKTRGHSSLFSKRVPGSATLVERSDRPSPQSPVWSCLPRRDLRSAGTVGRCSCRVSEGSASESGIQHWRHPETGIVSQTRRRHRAPGGWTAKSRPSGMNRSGPTKRRDLFAVKKSAFSNWKSGSSCSPLMADRFALSRGTPRLAGQQTAASRQKRPLHSHHCANSLR